MQEGAEKEAGTMRSKKEYQIHWATHHDVFPETPEEAVIYEMISEMANDSNSSKFRENITKWMVGLSESQSKHGYDDDTLAIEVKPQNYTRKATKLGGGGNFNDLTWRRHRKYLQDELLILQSGFHFGKLVYIVEFPYVSIAPILEARLQNILPHGDVPKVYDRWGTFKCTDWSSQPHKVRYLSPEFHHYHHDITPCLQQVLQTSPVDSSTIQAKSFISTLDLLL